MKAVRILVLAAFSAWQAAAHVEGQYGNYVTNLVSGCKYCPTEVYALTSAGGYIPQPPPYPQQVCNSIPRDEGFAAWLLRSKDPPMTPWLYYSAYIVGETTVTNDRDLGGKTAHVTHCACVDPATSSDLTDIACSNLKRTECGHYWKNLPNTSDPKTTRYKSWLTPYWPSTEYVPWYPSSYVNMSGVWSSNFTYDANTMIRLMGRCGHCLPGFIENQIELAEYDTLFQTWSIDSLQPINQGNREIAAGWNTAVAVEGADQPNILWLRRRVGSLRACATDPCFTDTGVDKCKPIHRSPCTAASPITCGVCDCGWGPTDYDFAKNAATINKICSLSINDICYTGGTLYGPNPDTPSVATVTGVNISNNHDIAFVPISNALCKNLSTAIACNGSVCFSYEKLANCQSAPGQTGNMTCQVITSKATFGWDPILRVCIRNPTDGVWHPPSTGPWPIYVVLTNPQLLTVSKAANILTVSEGIPTTVTYTVTVRFLAGDFPMLIKTMVDNKFGNIFNVGGSITRTTCVVNSTVSPANQVYTCEFDATLNLPTGSHTDNITVSFTSVPTGGFAVRSGTNVSNPVTVTVADVIPTISVTKAANPASIPEGTAGQTLQYTLTLKNTGVSTTDVLSITSLLDDKFGNVQTNQGSISATNCTNALLGTFGPGVEKRCVFSITSAAIAALDAVNSPHVNKVTLKMKDEENNEVNATATASLVINDVPPQLAVTKTASVASLNEGQAATVTYTITTSLVLPLTDSVTITSLVDSIYGDITTTGHDGITATTCVLNQVITTASFYRCTFTTTETAPNAGDHNNTVTSTGRDNEGTTRANSTSLRIPVLNTKPTLTVVKTGSSANPAGTQTVTEGTRTLVTFTVLINNTSPGGARDPITLTKLQDSKFGNFASTAVSGSGDSPSLASSTCTLGTVVVAGTPYTCTFTSYLTLGFNASTATHIDTITVAGNDDDNNAPTSNTGDITSNTVTITSLDVPPDMSIVYAVWPDSVPESAGENGVVKYNVIVTNTGVVSDPWTIVSMSDTRYGDVTRTTGNGNGQIRATTCGNPFPLVQPQSKYQCSFDVKIDQNTGTVDDTLNITVQDNELTRTSKTASKSLPVTNVAPVATLVAVPDLKNVKPVRYSILVENPSTSHDDLIIQKYWSGTLAIAAVGVQGLPQAPITSTDCTVPYTLSPGQSKSCYYELPLDLTINTTNNEPTVEGVDDDGVAFSVKGARSIVSVQLRCCDDPPWSKSLPGVYKLNCPTGYTAIGAGQMSRTCGTNGRWGTVDLSGCQDTPNCLTNTCNQHGTCVEGVGDAFTCQCAQGYSGVTCNVQIA